MDETLNTNTRTTLVENNSQIPLTKEENEIESLDPPLSIELPPHELPMEKESVQFQNVHSGINISISSTTESLQTVIENIIILNDKLVNDINKTLKKTGKYHS